MNPGKQPLRQIPADVIAAEDYERLAPDFLAPATLAYIAGGSGNEQTLQDNLNAFADLQIQPRLLTDCRHGNTARSLLGTPLPHPILLAPVGHQRLLHPEGELAASRAAAATDTCMIASTVSSVSLEEIARASTGPKWFQLYFQPRREHTLALLQRAEAAGYRAIVVTLDTPIQPVSRRAQRAGFRLPAELSPANLRDFPAPDQVVLNPGDSILFQGMMRDAPTWDDMAWLLTQTRLPILAKGVVNPADALRLRELGVAGLIVSNHGGRALDGMPATLRALPAIRNAVGADYPLLLDGGIRSGYDVFKALASGADAVLIGRPYLYALAVAGALGVAHLLKLLRDELELCMAMAGTPTLADIDRTCLLLPDIQASNRR